MLHEAIDWLISTIGSLGYPGIFLLMAMESSVIPVPSELIMPPAGYLVQQGRMGIVPVILSGTFGSLLGAYVNYFAARYLGRPFLLKFGCYVGLNEAKLSQVERYFEAHGEISTFIGRLLPVIRHLISLPAGLAGMSHWKFSAYTLLGSALWVSTLTWIGYLLGENKALVLQYSHQAVLAAIAGSVLLVVIYVLYHRRKQLKLACVAE
jgi:membrane protein DedA with SNARE-associated domain